MKTLISSIISLLFFASAANAQSLKIVYDFNKDELRYYKMGLGDKVDKEISQAIVGRNKNVQIEVINFNKFVYSANCVYEDSKVEETSSTGFFNVIKPLVFPTSTGSFFSSLGGTPPETGRGGLLSSKSAATAYVDLQAAYTTLAKLESNVSNIDYVIKKLNELKYNPYLPTDTIVRMSEHLVENLFAKRTVSTGDFVDLVVLYNENYNNATSQLKRSTSQFLNAYGDYASSRGGESFEGQGLDAYAKNLQTQLNAFTEELSSQDLTEKLNTLENLYTSIKVTTFTFNSSHMAKDDQIKISLAFFENAKDNEETQTTDLDEIEALKKIKDKVIHVTVKGDMKINSSIGLGFPYFSDNENFINKDSFIVSQSGNNYSPNLAAYINFYPYSGRIMNIGGTFGVGVPLTSENRTLNMFMGMSALFGSDNRVALHAGATLGQVKTLDQGFIVGDQLLSNTQEVPTINSWQWGGFAGISFSLAELNSPKTE